MPEQLLLVDIKPQLPTEDPSNPSNAYNDFKELSPQRIPGAGEQGDVIVYNVETDFQGIDKAHKESFVPRAKAKSAYVKLLPDISGLPEPSDSALSQQERERIINEGTIPEIRPFMAGARIVLAERRAKRQHQKAQSALRRIHVAHHVAEHAINETDSLAPEDKLRARTLVEKAMAQRMGRLVRRAKHHNSSANIVEDMFADPDRQVDFDRDKENLSFFEKRHRSSARKLYNLRREQSNRLIHGQRIISHRIPVVGKIFGKRIGLFSFDSLAAGGPGSPVKKAKKAIEKRDKAVLKTEALRQAWRLREAGEEARPEELRAFDTIIWEPPTEPSIPWRQAPVVPAPEAPTVTPAAPGETDDIVAKIREAADLVKRTKMGVSEPNAQKSFKELGDDWWTALNDSVAVNHNPSSTAEDIEAADAKVKSAYEAMYEPVAAAFREGPL
ncbi:MAG TPA: hypothetical protein VH234_02990 [Candidatus Saccharimonadales bacterium]|jgi:hypothetical protein|nr:hypothetical protein [Candidatus Saccharimonadales bacterium]